MSIINGDSMLTLHEFADMHNMSVQQVADIMTQAGHPPEMVSIFRDEEDRWDEMFLLRTVFPESASKPGLSNTKLLGRDAADAIMAIEDPFPAEDHLPAVESTPYGASQVGVDVSNPSYMSNVAGKSEVLKVKRIGNHDLPLPSYGSDGAACFDLRIASKVKTFTRDNGSKFMVFGSGFAFEVPDGQVMLVYIRSGVGCKSTARLSNCVGVIDSDYRGEVFITLDVTDADPEFNPEIGDRVCQAMLVDVGRKEIVEVDELSTTERGANGHGSTGLK